MNTEEFGEGELKTLRGSFARVTTIPATSFFVSMHVWLSGKGTRDAGESEARTYGGGVASSSLAKILGECSTIHSPPALFFFFFRVEISSRTLIPLFSPGSVHRGSVS